jgi:hypothetical protein
MKTPFDFRTEEQIACDIIAAAMAQIEIEAKQEALPKTASNYSKISKTNTKTKKNKVINQGW